MYRVAHGSLAWPGQILGRLQFKTMYHYASKIAPMQPFDMISSSKQVFHNLWTRLLHFQKTKNILFWPSYCTKSKLDSLLVVPSQTNKLDIDMLSWFFFNFFDDYYSACTYLQLPCFKVFFWRNIFILFLSRQPLVKKRIVLLKFVLIWGVLYVGSIIVAKTQKKII